MADTFSDDLNFFFLIQLVVISLTKFFNFRESLLCGLICYIT